MSEWTDEVVQSQLTRLLRRRLRSDELRKCDQLRILLLGALPGLPPSPTDSELAEALRSQLQTQLARVPEADEPIAQAVRVMVGLDGSDSSAGREPTLRRIAELVGRRRQGPTSETVHVGRRRAEQLEVEVLTPFVVKILTTHYDAPAPFTGVEVRMALTPGDSENLVRLRSETTFETADDRILIAITHRATVAEELCAQHSRLTNVWVSGSKELMKATTGYLWSVQPAGGLRELDFAEVTATEAGQLLEVQPEESSSVRWLAADVSEIPQPRRLRLLNDQQLLIADGYAYWSAPRMLWLDSWEIDISAFPCRADYRFFLHPFLGVGCAISEDERSGRYGLSVGERLRSGQGISMQWSRMAG